MGVAIRTPFVTVHSSSGSGARRVCRSSAGLHEAKVDDHLGLLDYPRRLRAALILVSVAMSDAPPGAAPQVEPELPRGDVATAAAGAAVEVASADGDGAALSARPAAASSRACSARHAGLCAAQPDTACSMLQ